MILTYFYKTCRIAGIVNLIVAFVDVEFDMKRRASEYVFVLKINIFYFQITVEYISDVTSYF